MGFWSAVGEFISEVVTEVRISQDYPTLKAAMYKYIDGEDYYIIRHDPPFFAELEKQGVFGKKTVTLSVLEDGSVHVKESGLLGEESIFPKTTGTPMPQQFLQMMEAQKQQQEVYEPTLQECYDALGCKPSATDAEVNQCYRDLCQQYHPDKIQSKKLAPDFVEYAEHRFKEIQYAYEVITESRKGKK